VSFLEKGIVFISSLASNLLHGGVAVDGYKWFRRCSDIHKFCWFYVCTGIASTWFVRSNATNLIKGCPDDQGRFAWLYHRGVVSPLSDFSSAALILSSSLSSSSSSSSVTSSSCPPLSMNFSSHRTSLMYYSLPP
jgi:hypothetical protein